MVKIDIGEVTGLWHFEGGHVLSRVGYWLFFESSSMSECSTGVLGDKTGFAARLIGTMSSEFRARRVELGRPLCC